MAESYCVYVHTFPNGKKYVGQSKEPAENRWRNGNGYKNQPLLNNAILKYGWENVKHDLVCSGVSQEVAWSKEIEFIKTLNTNALDSGDGYNMSGGGESGSRGYKHTAEHKQRISGLISGTRNGFYGKKHTEETRSKISAANKGKVMSKESRQKMSKSRSGAKHFQFGKARSAETRARLSVANRGDKSPVYGLKGRDCPHAKSYRCIETGIVFGCLSEAQKSTNADAGHISSACTGRRKTAGGYHWEYAK